MSPKHNVPPAARRAAPARNYSDPAGDLGMLTGRGHLA